ncbi:uncharacterized protein UDID_03305 [Ustilago sp. UG-2017a]|nr:uncharacterized protein UDID_03305 [Ustilago sp. UG-2017a]
MMPSRGFVLSENQAFAGQTRTPGASRFYASPTRKAMTTGKRALGQSSSLFGQEMASAGPKQLFQDLMSSKSPVKALGNRNAAKTPGPSRSASGKQDGSLRKGKGADNSPTKKGSSELSPRKASTSNALRSINGKQRQNVDLPFSKPGQGSTKDEGSNMMMIKTPAPTQLNGKARTMSRQKGFVTPAANIGRAGQIKARMGEILDAEMGLSLQKAENLTEQVTEEPGVQMTEEEMYPEIEYMPHRSKHAVFEFPDELEDLPRAKEIGAQLSKFSTINLRAAGPEDLSDMALGPMELADDDDLLSPAFGVDSEDDDPWPNVPVEEEPGSCSTAPGGAIGMAATWTKVATRPSVSVQPKSTNGARMATTAARPSAAPLTKRPMSSGTRAPVSSASASASATVRSVPGKAAGKPVTRSTGLQRSIAAAPGSRGGVRITGSASRAAVIAVRPTATASRSTVRPTAATRPTTVKAPVAQSAKPAASQTAATKPAATRLNPKLIDFVDDELGKQTAATLERLEAEDDIEALQLDFDEPIDGEA